MRYRLILTIICAVAVIRVAATFHIFNATTDEPSHIANGYAWLTGAPYPRDLLHPPLAQALAALPLVLKGAPKPLAQWDVVAGNELLYHDRQYMRNVELARIGNLIFLIIGVIAVAVWGRRVFDPITGLVAAALWSLQPTLLAHCGLATTDATIIGLFPVAMLVLERFIELPGVRRAIELGAVCGLATLGKFSFVPFFIVAALVYAYRLRVKHLKGIAISAVVLLFVLWAGYRFSFGTIIDSHPNAPTVVVEEMSHFDWMARHVPLPAPQFFTGIGALAIHNRHGQLAYLLGEYNRFGFRSYFPVLLFYKTPLAFLLLFAWGVVAVARHRRGWLPLAAGLAILVSVMPSHINVGVRHVVPLYAAFAIVAAFGIITAWNETRGMLFGRTALASLCLWLVAAGAFAHPDYLPYFNELARHPEQIATDSNLDWGQDWERFIRWQNRTHPGNVGIVWYGSIDLSRHPIEGYGLQPYTKAAGWIVASETGMRLASTNEHDVGEPYRWLEAYQPVMHIGKSIRVYRIEE
ncbi:MAG TPA: glycosyltransferase family 39 protein [Thermoanaerobaculia bacterium]|nr:glycosyltransferase family 39 protein [Thermoanaerobaculia bacterium]